jgi:polysaccharide pyruvyl transferase WcaK-like protein
MKLLFNGAYTINSAGDDAALDAILSMLRASPTTTEVNATVLSRHANSAFDEAFGVTTEPNLEYESKAASVGRWLQGFNFGDAPDSLLGLVKHFEEADLVVLGAGNFLNENSFGLFRGMLPRFCVGAFLASLTNTPCLLYGLSASRLESPLAQRMAAWLLRTATHVTFREKQSVDLLQQLGIEIPSTAEILPDPVLAARCAPREELNHILRREGIQAVSDRPRIAIGLRCLAHLGSEVQERFWAALQFALDRWTGRGGEILFIPQCTYEHDKSSADDRKLAAELASRLANPDRILQIGSPCWPWETAALYGICDLALCVRLHAGVFACRHGIPTLAFGYEPKVEGFWDSMGLAEYCLPLDIPPESLWEQIELSRTSYPLETMGEQVASLQRQCRRYATIVEALVSGTSAPARAAA